MLKEIKRLGISILLIGSLVLTGCSKEDRLEATVNRFENEYLELYEELEEMEGTNYEAIEKVEEFIKKSEKLEEEIEKEIEKYETYETEYKMYNELREAISSINEAFKILKTVAENNVDDSEALETIILLAACMKNVENSIKDYKEYKAELGLKTTVTTSTNEEEVKEKTKTNQEESLEETEADPKQKTEEKKEEPVEEKKETKQQPVTYYCEWCESTAHNSNDHIGTCYNCGTEKPVTQMTYNGRAFECGCKVVGECYECGAVLREPLACYFLNQLVCPNCYDDLMTYNCISCGGDLADGHITVEGNKYCYLCYDQLYAVEEYPEPCDDYCWNCGSANIYVHDAYGNYTCNDCGEFTQ